MMLFEKWRAARRRRRLAAGMAAAQRAGTGLHMSEWQLTLVSGAPPNDVAAVEPILSWCREVLATCRRPWGIDHFDLVLAWRHAEGAPSRRTRLRGLRPTDLYEQEWLAGRLLGLLAGAEAVHVAAGLVSWGDAAHAALGAAS